MNKWWIGTALTIIGLLIAAGFFHGANIVKIREIGSDNTCPSNVYTNFKVNFINHGNKDTSLCVTAFSDEVNFTKNSDCLYMSRNDKDGSGFNLKIDDESIPEYRLKSNITIIYNYKYQKNLFQIEDRNVTCEYEKKENSRNFQII